MTGLKNVYVRAVVRLPINKLTISNLTNQNVKVRNIFHFNETCVTACPADKPYALKGI